MECWAQLLPHSEYKSIFSSFTPCLYLHFVSFLPRFLFNASSCIKKREKNQQGPCRSQPWTPWRSFSEQSCLICQCTVTGDLELEFGGKQWHELNCDVKLNVRPIFAVTLSPNLGLPRAFSGQWYLTLSFGQCCCLFIVVVNPMWECTGRSLRSTSKLAWGGEMARDSDGT